MLIQSKPIEERESKDVYVGTLDERPFSSARLASDEEDTRWWHV